MCENLITMFFTAAHSAYFLFCPMPSTPVTISRSRLLKQYLRWLPAQLGLINKGAFLLQINDILPDDVFIVSYPKSGNTWLRYIIAYAIRGTEHPLSSDELENVVSDVYTSKDIIDSKIGNRFIKTHDALFRYYPKTIYIYRDYRDVLVSFYEYKLALKEYNGSFSDFIRSNEVSEPFGSWEGHVNNALLQKKSNPDSILLLKYEDLLTDFETNTIKLLSYSGVQQFDIEKLKTATGFTTLQKNENQQPGEFKKRSGKNFFREGTSQNWKNHFSDTDIDWLYSNRELCHTLTQLKYAL